ncbi:MAG: hypothetical protein IJ387_12595 [Thermoguttaceae bacterium]|nr:hypothetical protein [Thermoguttaceae bacterium]
MAILAAEKVALSQRARNPSGGDGKSRRKSAKIGSKIENNWKILPTE